MLIAQLKRLEERPSSDARPRDCRYIQIDYCDMLTHLEPEPSNPAPPPLSEDLLRQRNDAQQHFHEAKEDVEEAIESTEFRHQERVNEATDHFRKAEKELEQVEEKIESVLPPAPPP